MTTDEFCELMQSPNGLGPYLPCLVGAGFLPTGVSARDPRVQAVMSRSQQRGQVGCPFCRGTLEPTHPDVRNCSRCGIQWTRSHLDSAAQAIRAAFEAGVLLRSDAVDWLTIGVGGEPAVTLTRDGRLGINPKFTMTEASFVFWEAVRVHFDQYTKSWKQPPGVTEKPPGADP